MNDKPTLVRFVDGYDAAGISEDGLPYFKQTVKIFISRPPLLEITRVATDEDIDMYEDAYRLYQREKRGKEIGPEADGYPLSMWPVVTPALHAMLSAREIYTIEQLASMRLSSGVPAEVKELADRAKRMVAMSKDIGQHEQRERDFQGQIEVLQEQVKELRGTIQAQDGIINSLKLRVA